MNEIERLSPLLDADLLRTFLAVASAGNVTRASAALARTQSAISVQIRRLETALGVTLFERLARGMALTPDGERLRPVARRIVDDLAALQAVFAAPVAGTVRIGIPDDYGSTVLPAILARFARRHPGVEVSVRSAFSAQFPDAVAKGDLDLAVHAAEPGAGDGTLLVDEPTVWAAHGDWLRRADEPLPLAMFDRACWWRESAIVALTRARLDFRIMLESESAYGVKAAINAGLAVGVLAAGTLDAGMRVLDGDAGLPPLPNSRLVLLMSERTSSPALSAMAEAIRQGFAPANAPAH